MKKLNSGFNLLAAGLCLVSLVGCGTPGSYEHLDKEQSSQQAFSQAPKAKFATSRKAISTFPSGTLASCSMTDDLKRAVVRIHATNHEKTIYLDGNWSNVGDKLYRSNSMVSVRTSFKNGVRSIPLGPGEVKCNSEFIFKSTTLDYASPMTLLRDLGVPNLDFENPTGFNMDFNASSQPDAAGGIASGAALIRAGVEASLHPGLPYFYMYADTGQIKIENGPVNVSTDRAFKGAIVVNPWDPGFAVSVASDNMKGITSAKLAVSKKGSLPYPSAVPLCKTAQGFCQNTSSTTQFFGHYATGVKVAIPIPAVATLELEIEGETYVKVPTNKSRDSRQSFFKTLVGEKTSNNKGFNRVNFQKLKEYLQQFKVGYNANNISLSIGEGVGLTLDMAKGAVMFDNQGVTFGLRVSSLNDTTLGGGMTNNDRFNRAMEILAAIREATTMSVEFGQKVNGFAGVINGEAQFWLEVSASLKIAGCESSGYLQINTAAERRRDTVKFIPTHDIKRPCSNAKWAELLDELGEKVCKKNEDKDCDSLQNQACQLVERKYKNRSTVPSGFLTECRRECPALGRAGRVICRMTCKRLEKKWNSQEIDRLCGRTVGNVRARICKRTRTWCNTLY